jgi:hypothetical protein
VKPPTRLIRFLLDGLALDQGLVGDLHEEGARRGALWLAREALMALLLRGYHDLRTHGWLAVRALLVAWLAIQGCEWLLRPLSRFLNGWMLDQLIRKLGSHPVVMLWATDLHSIPTIATVAVVSGSVVARCHRGHPGIIVAVTGAVAAWSFATSLMTALIPWTSMPGYVNLPLPLFTVLSRPLLVLLFMNLGAFAGAIRRRAA